MQLQDFLRLLPPSSALTPFEILTALGFSLFSSLVVLWLYHTYYGSQHIGAGVHRFFLLGGPAVTGMFLAIQFSLPLSLGLLGALAFVRFRVPVKDPAEVGFILLLIAASLSSATFNYWLAVILLALALAALGGQRLAAGRLPGRKRSYLMVSLEGPNAMEMEANLKAVLGRMLPGLRLESASTLEGRVSFHYQFSRRGEIDWGAFHREVNAAVAPAKANILMS